MSMSEPSIAMNAAENMKQAWEHFRARRARLAEQLARQVIAEGASNADAARLLGVLAYRAGHTNTSMKACSRSIAHSARRFDIPS